MIAIQFFTNPYGKWPYHLIPYSIWRRGYKKPFTEIIVDPGVNSLVGNAEYPYINEYPISVPDNAWWVIPDYPHDVGPDLDATTCIEKTRENIVKWNTCPRSVPSVQYEFENLDSFKKSWTWTYPFVSNGMIGIGNLCKSRKLVFLKKVIDHIAFNNPNKYKVHFFGLGKPGILYIEGHVFDFPISVDSMKWDYRLHKTDSNLKDVRWEKFFTYLPKVRDKQTRLI